MKERDTREVEMPEENMVRVAGRLVKNAFVRDAATGKMATFMLKVPRTYHTEDDERVDHAYVPVVAWRSVAERAAKLGKGSAVIIEGYIHTWAKEEGKGYGWQVTADEIRVRETRERVAEEPRAAREAAAAAA